MRVEPTKQAVLSGGTGGFMPDRNAGHSADDKPQTRAMVVTAPTAPASEPLTSQRQAAFLAHLIATKEHAPQTRERRRAEPEEAIAAYRAAAKLASV
jgi:hypothetical protein